MTSFRVHGGRGGVKKSQILAYVLYGWPLTFRDQKVPQGGVFITSNPFWIPHYSNASSENGLRFSGCTRVVNINGVLIISSKSHLLTTTHKWKYMHIPRFPIHQTIAYSTVLCSIVHTGKVNNDTRPPVASFDWDSSDIMQLSLPDYMMCHVCCVWYAPTSLRWECINCIYMHSLTLILNFYILWHHFMFAENIYNCVMRRCQAASREKIL